MPKKMLNITSNYQDIAASTLDEAIEKLEHLREEFGANATLVFSAEDAEFFVQCDRLETDEEEAKRESREALVNAQGRASRKSTYEALKKEFGGV